MGGWLLGDGVRRRDPGTCQPRSSPPSRQARHGADPMTEVVTLGECLVAFVATTPGPLAEATTFDRFVVGRRGERRGRARAARSFGRVHRPGRCRRVRRGDRAPPPRRGRRHHGPRDRSGRPDRADVPRTAGARPGPGRLRAERTRQARAWPPPRSSGRWQRRHRQPLAPPDGHHAGPLRRRPRGDRRARSSPARAAGADDQPRPQPAPPPVVGRGSRARPARAGGRRRRGPRQPGRTGGPDPARPPTTSPAELARAALGLGPSIAVVKLGAAGAAGGRRATRPDEVVVRPAFPLPVVVDPVGAGDAFCAGFIAARLDGADLGDRARDGQRLRRGGRLGRRRPDRVSRPAPSSPRSCGPPPTPEAPTPSGDRRLRTRRARRRPDPGGTGARGTTRRRPRRPGPGRVNLIGEHTDYNEGLVLPAAIDLEIRIAYLPTDDRQVRLRRLDDDERDGFDLDEPRPEGRDVARLRRRHGLGAQPRPACR